MNFRVKTKKFISAVTLVFLFFQIRLFAQTYKPVNISLSEGLAQSSVYKIVQDKQGFIWMATQDGLNRYDGLQFKIFRENPFDTNTLSSSYITALMVDHNGWLWVGTQAQGLNLYIPSTSQFRHFFSDGVNGISHNIINDIYKDESHIIWVSTAKGFSRISITGNDPATTQMAFMNFYRLRDMNDKEEEINVSKMYADRPSNVWAGTRDGLFRLNFNGDVISNVSVFSTENNSGISDNFIHTMCEDGLGNFWIGNSGGLDKFDKNTGKFVSLFKKDKNLVNVLHTQVIFNLCPDAAGNLWIGTGGGGLFKLNKENLNAEFISSGVEHIRLGNERLTTTIHSISEDKINPGLIWIGTFAGGSYKLVPVLKNFYSDHLEYPRVVSPVVTCLLKDNNNFIWLGTQNGLIRQNKKNGEIKIFMDDQKDYSMMANFIRSVLQDEHNNLWVGTDIGVQRIQNPSSPSP